MIAVRFRAAKLPDFVARQDTLAGVGAPSTLATPRRQVSSFAQRETKRQPAVLFGYPMLTHTHMLVLKLSLLSLHAGVQEREGSFLLQLGNWGKKGWKWLVHVVHRTLQGHH